MAGALGGGTSSKARGGGTVTTVEAENVTEVADATTPEEPTTGYLVLFSETGSDGGWYAWQDYSFTASRTEGWPPEGQHYPHGGD